MTGIYLGMLSMQYAVSKDPKLRSKASDALEALNLLCTISGIRGLLVRAATPLNMPFDDDGLWRISKDRKYRWRGDVSSDQMDAVFYGYMLAYDLVANDAQQKVIAGNIADMVDYLLQNDRRIIGFDGKPTKWGNYYPQYVQHRENMNALLLLQHLKVAHHITADERFAKAYRQIAIDEGYAEIALTARNTRLPKLVNYSDDLLLALAYFTLLRLEQDPLLRDMYMDSFKRAWQGVNGLPGMKHQLNPYYNFMGAMFLGDNELIEAGLESLRVFPLDMKWNHNTIARYQIAFGFKFNPAQISPLPKAGHAMPLDRRKKQWSAWVHNPYKSGERSKDHDMEFTGLDYLMAYWLGRWKGYIKPSQ